MAETHEWFKDEHSGQYVQDLSITVDAPAEQCFRYWADFETFPMLMRDVKEVRKTGDHVWHWEAEVAGMRMSWDAEMTEMTPGSGISWRAVSGLRNSGSVRFMPEGMGSCRITVHLMYDPPLGPVGDMVAERRVNDQFHEDLKQDLLDFKRAVESGQVARYRRAA